MQPVKIGDAVERVLAKLGITPSRIERALGISDCGCRGRAATLNEIGNRLQWSVIMFIGGPMPLPWKSRLRVAFRKIKRRFLLRKI